MAKDPAVLFYTSDFLSGTFTMTLEEKGAYITLLCLQHQKGKLTDRDLHMYKDMSEVIGKFEKLEDGFYYNLKMKDCTEKRKLYSESRRNNRLKKTTSKQNISKTYDTSYDKDIKNTSTTYVKHMENENENENINEAVSENEVKILSKLEDKLLNITTFLSAYNEIKEYGGVEKYYNALGYDESQRENWNRHINTKLEILT